MKVNMFKRYKWYLFVAVVVALILSVGLSFCLWDNDSILSKFDGNVAHYNNHPTWAKKAVGEDFTDNSGLRWLIVDKTVAGNTTNLVLMTYHVTEQRPYELTFTNPDYNSPMNNIRGYLNDTWYPTIDAEIREFAVPKVTAYKAGTIFYQFASHAPSVTPVESTSNMAWLPSSDEIGLGVRMWHDKPFYKHDNNFSYFPMVELNVDYINVGADSKRMATTKAGEAVHWWTRTGVYSHLAVVADLAGAVEVESPHWITQNNWLRPCVQVQFIA